MPNPFADPRRFDRRAPECAVVIFGANGDLAKRKLIPALYRLSGDGKLPESFVVIGNSRTPMSDEAYREKMRDDIALYVGEGTLDLGITGRDMLADSGANADLVLDLGFGASTFRIAAPRGTVTGIEDLAGLRIATSYPGILEQWLIEQGIPARVVRLDGAVENAVALDRKSTRLNSSH